MSLKPLVPIFMGSNSDSKHCESIAKELAKYGIESVLRVSSAHKTPGRVMEILKKYEQDSRPKVYITVAGRSNALSGFADASVSFPVIACPPYSDTFGGNDVFSSIRMPSGVAPMLVLDPSGAALACAKIFSLIDSSIREKVIKVQTENAQALFVADAQMKTQSYLPLIAEERSKTNSNLEFTMEKNDLSVFKPSEEYIGKVRDRYKVKDKVILITTDRVSAFDRVLTTIPFKGKETNKNSAFWFKETEHIISNHMISVPCGHVLIAKKAEPFPIEFVVRGYMTGSTDTSIWVNYNNGVRNYCGVQLPEGMIKNQKLPEIYITPTTKDVEHDELISPAEIVAKGYMKKADWDFCAKKAIELFVFGQKLSEEHGLILVDTKYEFGKTETGEIILIDEIHTPDSSRYWIANTYEQRMREGKSPDNIDKDFVRQWYRDNSDPYKDAVLPEAPNDLRDELSRRYLQLYEMITGQDFDFEFARISHNANIVELLKKEIN